MTSAGTIRSFSSRDLVNISRLLPTSIDGGARHPHQVDQIGETMGWSLDQEAMREIDRILENRIVNPVGPEFMAPAASSAARAVA
jgi:hypothetical protein